ncbi:MAG: hypothetical protein K2Q22_11355, partial [Cytophagales bacterium]|nr:hypothetical protein [Cytophagales bacterium]
MYEFRFSLQDILNKTLSVEPYASLKNTLPSYYTIDDINRTYSQWVYEYMTNMMLDVDVRAYCAQNSYPFFKTVSFIDKCGGNLTCDANKNGYTSMVPIAEYSGKFLVNCPGCKIPGANVNSGTIYRENMGYTDANDDGVADKDTRLPITHPNSRMISNGDTMAVIMDISMSDGESKTGVDSDGKSIGVLKTELDAAGYFLDNLYVSIDHPGPSEYYAPEYGLLPLTADASIDGGTTWVPMQIIDQRLNGYTLLRVNSTSFSSTLTSFNVSQNVKVKFRSIMGYMSDRNDSYEINYAAGYSPSETVTTVGDFIKVNGTLNKGISGTWSTTYISYDDLINQNNTYFICTSFSNTFKYIYRSKDFYVENRSDYSFLITCEKDIWLVNRLTYSGPNNNYLNEIRNTPDVRIMELPIPKGFSVGSLYMQNRDYTDQNQKYQYLNTAANETSKDWKIYQEYTLGSADFSKYPSAIQIVNTG